MQMITITGKQALHGRIRPAAAKNSTLPLLAATLLCRGPCRLQEVPALADVTTSLALLQAVGADVRRCGADLCTRPVQTLCGEIPECLAGAMRSSVFYLAPLLCRTGYVRLPLPGGCRLGPRPVDIHLAGLAAMGAEVELEGIAVTLRRKGPLHGVDFTLRLPSVGATLTLLMAACCARGRTVLRGAAREPEVADLADFLNRCGGSVEGAGSSTLVIEGRRALGGCVFSPLPDRIFASTLACAAAAAGGRVELTGCSPELYAPVLEILAQMGCRVERGGENVQVARFGRLYGAGRVFTGVYPALATDAAPPLAAAMLCAEGESSIEDVIFERRFACAEGFAALGGRVNTAGRVLHIRPGGALRGTRLSAPDLRGGAALVLAALAAQGRSQIGGVAYLDRGYADFTEILASLGARIYRETKPA